MSARNGTGECPGCRHFDRNGGDGGPLGFVPGCCRHAEGPLEAHTATRLGRPVSVSTGTRLVSGGMTCQRFALAKEAP